MFACALLVFAMSVWVVTRDYDETRQTAKQAHLTSTRNAQSIESISRTQANLAQLYEKTSESLRKVELEQARRGYGN